MNHQLILFRLLFFHFLALVSLWANTFPSTITPGNNSYQWQVFVPGLKWMEGKHIPSRTCIEISGVGVIYTFQKSPGDFDLPIFFISLSLYWFAYSILTSKIWTINV
jgi:hypothetical protein